MKDFTHIDNTGKANMVDVSHKPNQLRKAVAKGSITLSRETIKKIQDYEMKKGDVLTVAKIAGIQASKATSSLIPLCHNLLLTKADVTFRILTGEIEATCTTVCTGQTGVEMEALTGVSVALLTIYDMCKAVDKSMIISNIHLVSKTKDDVGS